MEQAYVITTRDGICHSSCTLLDTHPLYVPKMHSNAKCTSNLAYTVLFRDINIPRAERSIHGMKLGELRSDTLSSVAAGEHSSI